MTRRPTDPTAAARPHAATRARDRLTIPGRTPAPSIDGESVLAALAVIQSYQGDLVARLERLMQSAVLFSATVQIPDASNTTHIAGRWYRTWHVPFRAVQIGNYTAATIVVGPGSSAGGDVAPGVGVGGNAGVHELPPGARATFHISGHDLFVFGTPGGHVDVQVFSRSDPPA